MRLTSLALISGLTLAGCVVVPLPDGSQVSRLPEAYAPAPVLSADERRRYDELDRQAQRDQQAARESEQRSQEAEARRRAAPPYPLYPDYYYGYGWPHIGWSLGWFWTGRHWAWRPRWGVGIHIGP